MFKELFIISSESNVRYARSNNYLNDFFINYLSIQKYVELKIVRTRRYK